MALTVTASLSFAGNTATVNVTVSGGTAPYSVIYGWDDGTTTVHGGVTAADSASHLYGVYDYDVPPVGPHYPGVLNISAGDVLGAATQIALALPVPQPFVSVTPNTGRAPLTATVAGININSPYAPGATDVTYAYSSSDGWTYTAGGAGSVSHTWNTQGTYSTVLRITNSLGWAASATLISTPTVVGRAALRQFPRDDYLGGAPRQGKANGATSIQSSTRQGWTNTYR